ncbi:MAG: HAD-IIA family hydrolase, partial [Firmicutes bacterium]|nr:HAD-IIA family hydrolase [Bacillota bacterium]
RLHYVSGAAIMTAQRPQGLILDLDGTLYRGDEPIAGAVEFVAALRRAGLPFVCATNNSARTAEQVATRMREMGFAVDQDDVFTSALLVAQEVSNRFGRGARVFAIGEAGLLSALADIGAVNDEMHPEVVVMGLDREFTYAKLRIATRAIAAGAAFIATNADRVLPEEVGFAPGAGSLLAALETACGRPPEVLGKPNPLFIHAACRFLSLPPEMVMVVGDSGETDIAAGLAAGCVTALVETGVGPAAGPIQAHETVASLLDLLPLVFPD